MLEKLHQDAAPRDKFYIGLLSGTYSDNVSPYSVFYIESIREFACIRHEGWKDDLDILRCPGKYGGVYSFLSDVVVKSNKIWAGYGRRAFVHECPGFENVVACDDGIAPEEVFFVGLLISFFPNGKHGPYSLFKVEELSSNISIGHECWEDDLDIIRDLTKNKGALGCLWDLIVKPGGIRARRGRRADYEERPVKYNRDSVLMRRKN